MKDKQWVQHISGSGKKWAVHCEEKYLWVVEADYVDGQTHRPFLPKSEYRLCNPPERWEDVTGDVEVVSRGEYSNLVYNGENVRVDKGGYRLRKVQMNMVGPGVPNGCQKQWAFIVERKVME